MPFAERVHPLEPDRAELAAMMSSATTFVSDFIGSLDTAPASDATVPEGMLADLLAPPGEQPGDFDRLLATFGEAAARAVETAGPGCYAYFPGGGLFASAVAELLSATVNRYTGSGAMAPALVAMEHGVIRWLAGVFGLPATAGGLLTTGASTGTLSALLAARQEVLGGPPNTGTIYVTEHTHHSVAKAARIAGFSPGQVRVVPADAGLRMDPGAAEELLVADRARGRRPFLLVGTAGTTSTGTIDPLPDLAGIARRHGVWFHVDAAYGGAFQLTERGRAKLTGVEQADSIALDPHKSLFLPYSTGVLLVRDVRKLAAAQEADADYLQDLHLDSRLPNFADLGTEMSRPFRGLRLWLPLHLYGVEAFRATLDEKLDLAEVAHRSLQDIPSFEQLTPDLTVLNFRTAGGDAVNQRLLDTINASGRVALTSVRVRDRFMLRMCVLNHRTHRAHLDEALRIVRQASWSVTRGAGHRRPVAQRLRHRDTSALKYSK
ncbi:pyridoxal phosphate-dependent decarboxylase family protein [Nonomuraea jiangxiensis]|uniref:Aromatic-L-amino-acid decarboxylase n=1 Tax=Nonomuraea jiangxiensis TaxID=633440 RepID=A0A1G8ID29_9ACTN|nr:aminotransferase class V-fold PLP-dependent enzyme [Nonomuraea jiangxiensis]SDI16691.1 aromatic-L-amino-acid decarboxylase [Nonomuraea jiangxiensis]